MHATTVAVDLAKDVFELALADRDHRLIARKRRSRAAFARCLENAPPCTVLMEACGSAHYWGRRFAAQGHTPRLLPPRDVRPYVRRNKTDRTDAAGLLEADRCAEVHPVPIKSAQQQGIQALHRIREQLKAQRTATLNLLRGVLREFGSPCRSVQPKCLPPCARPWKAATTSCRWRCAPRWPGCWNTLTRWPCRWPRSKRAAGRVCRS